MKVRHRVVIAALAASVVSGCKDRPTSLVDDYLNQSECEGRLQFILHPEKNKPALAAHYADNKDCVAEHGKIDASACKDVSVGGQCEVNVEKIGPLCVKRVSEEDYKIDWQCSVGWNDVSAAQLQSTPQKLTVPFRAMVKLSSYSSSSFSNEEKYAIEVSDSTGTLHGIVDRKSVRGAELFERVKGGGKHTAFLYLAHDMSAKNQNLSEVWIVDVLSDTWIWNAEVEERLKRRGDANEALHACCTALLLTPIRYSENDFASAFSVTELTRVCNRLLEDIVENKTTPDAAVAELRGHKNASYLPAACKPKEAAPKPEDPEPACDTSKLSEPEIKFKPLEVTGKMPVPAEELDKVVRGMQQIIRQCYDRSRCHNPKLGGDVAVRFTIGEDGRVTDVANRGSDVPDSSVVSCVVRAHSRLSFPKLEGAVTAVSSVKLSPKK